MRLSQFEGSGFVEKWAAALASHRGRGTSVSILIDGDAVVMGRLQPILRTNAGLVVRGLPGLTRITAGVPLQNIIRVDDNCGGVAFESLLLDGRNTVSQALIDSGGPMARFSGMTFMGSAPDGYCAGLAVAGSRTSIERCKFQDLAMGLRIRSAKRPMTAVSVLDCNYSRIGRRALSVASGGPPISGITVRNARIEMPAKTCQPVRIDAARGTVRKVSLLDGHIIDTQSEGNADDALSINSGVSNFVVSGWTIRRHSDVGINVSGGCRNGVITRNSISGPDYGVNIGALRDRAIARNRNIDVSGNTIADCRKAIFRVFESDRVSFHGNFIGTESTKDVPLLEFRNSRDISLNGNEGQTTMPNLDAGQGTDRSSFRRVEGLFLKPPRMSPRAVPGQSHIVIHPDQRKVIWDGKQFR